MSNLDEYIATAERMFAGFFMGLRCDTQPQSRDLSGEASELLAISRDQFLEAFRRGNEWLEHVRSCGSLEEYINGFASGVHYNNLVPVFLVPQNCVQRVQSWTPNRMDGDSITALLASYRFYADHSPFPQWLTTDTPIEIQISVGE
jgi:hypothetical protein